MRGEILLVEDSDDDAEIFAIAAKQAGLENPIRLALTGEAALDLVLKQGRRFLLIVLDVKMPGIGGIEALRRMRADPAGSRARVVMLTGSDLASDREAAFRLGCDLFLTKPSSYKGYIEMLGTLRRFCAQTEADD